MAVYRPRKRRPLVRISVLAFAFILLALLAIRTGQGGHAPGQEADPRAALEQIRNALEVLILSHYTEATVSEGRVLQEAEYQAALQDLELVQNLWPHARILFNAERQRTVQEMLIHLRELVNTRASAQEVQASVRDLLKLLLPSGRDTATTPGVSLLQTMPVVYFGGNERCREGRWRVLL